MEMRVALVGCGLIGGKRARVLGPARLVAAVDADPQRARRLAAQHPGCAAATDWREAVARDDVDLVIVSTTNDHLAPVALEAVCRGKHRNRIAGG